MSNSFLYYAIGIRGYQYVSNRYEFGEVIFRIVKRQQDLLCSVFGSLIVICKGTGRNDSTVYPSVPNRCHRAGRSTDNLSGV